MVANKSFPKFKFSFGKSERVSQIPYDITYMWDLEDEMVGWHHQLNGHEFEQTVGDDGQGSLACCSSWGRRVRYDLAAKQ